MTPASRRSGPGPRGRWSMSDWLWAVLLATAALPFTLALCVYAAFRAYRAALMDANLDDIRRMAKEAETNAAFKQHMESMYPK